MEEKANAEKNKKLALLAEEKRRKDEEDAIINAIYEDKPIISNPYLSETSETTGKEVFELSTQNERLLVH